MMEPEGGYPKGMSYQRYNELCREGKEGYKEIRRARRRESNEWLYRLLGREFPDHERIAQLERELGLD